MDVGQFFDLLRFENRSNWGNIHRFNVRLEMDSSSIPLVVNNHISVKAAAEFSRYSLQYFCRLLRTGKLESFKIGQVWLIEKTAFEAYLEKAIQTTDRRFGPQ